MSICVSYISIKYLVPAVTETDVAMVAGAVTASTRANYGSASILWNRYGIEAGYNIDDPFLGALNDSDRSLTIARFLKWMVESQLVKTSVACRLLTGLRFHFVTHYQDVGVFSSDAVRMAKTTAKRLEPTVLWLDRPNGQPPMPFVMELLDDLRASHWESFISATVDTKMVYIAVAFASNFGRRPGEVAWMGKSKADHRFCWEDVIFELKYSESDTILADILTFTQYISLPLPRPELELVRVTKRTSKMSAQDIDGQMLFIAPVMGNAKMTQFFNDFLDWVNVCGVIDENAMVFSRVAYVSRNSRRSTLKMLTSQMFVEGMRTAGRRHGLPDACFTGKSPRINSVTNTSMAGHTTAHTKAITGHASDSAMNMYKRTIHGANRLSAADTELPISNSIRGSCVFADPPCLTAHDLKRTINHAIVVKQARVQRDSITSTAEGGSLKRVGRLLVNAINPGIHR